MIYKFFEFCIFFRYDSGTKDFRNKAFGTAKLNKVACEFLGSRNFAVQGSPGVYKNAVHDQVNYLGVGIGESIIILIKKYIFKNNYILIIGRQKRRIC